MNSKTSLADPVDFAEINGALYRRWMLALLAFYLSVIDLGLKLFKVKGLDNKNIFS